MQFAQFLRGLEQTCQQQIKMATKNLKINVQKNNEVHKGFLCVSSCSLIFIFFCYFYFVTQCNGVCSVQVRDAKGAPCKGYETSRLSLSERCPFVINRAVGTYKDLRTGLHHILSDSNEGSRLCSPQKLFPSDFF